MEEEVSLKQQEAIVFARDIPIGWSSHEREANSMTDSRRGARLSRIATGDVERRDPQTRRKNDR